MAQSESITHTKEEHAPGKGNKARQGMLDVQWLPQNEQIRWGITAFLAAAACIAFAFALFNIQSISEAIAKFLTTLEPAIYGLAIAYVMAPLADLLEFKVLPWIHKKARPIVLQAMHPLLGEKGRRSKTNPSKAPDSNDMFRIAATALAMAALLGMVALFFVLIAPELASSIETIAANSPRYYESLHSRASQLISRNPKLAPIADSVLEWSSSWITEQVAPNIHRIIASISAGIYMGFSFLGKLAIGMVLATYVLANRRKAKAQARQIAIAVCGRKASNKLVQLVSKADSIMGSYLKSSFIDSGIIGIACFVCCRVMGIPYPEFIGAVVGITNIIPFFGPFLGAIPCGIIVLMAEPEKCVWFAAMILVLQQCDGNLIKPRLFGKASGISGFWVITSIMIGGGLFGPGGMFLAVPVFTIISQIAGKWIKETLPTRR